MATQSTGATSKAAFTAAAMIWRQGATTPSAVLNEVLRSAAKTLSGAHDAAYAEAVSDLFALATTPETGLTEAQIAQSQARVTYLDGFFNTPGLYR